jgi:hypothetical protein
MVPAGRIKSHKMRKGDRMKKLLTAFLAMAFFVGTIGCGEKAKTTKPADTKKAAAAPADATPAPPAPAPDKDKK